ncbi:MAG: hypothetical protein ACO1N0_20315 [Fluviicola sp.]
MKKIIILILATAVAAGCKKEIIEKKSLTPEIKNELFSGGGTTSFERKFSFNSSVEAWSVCQTADGKYLCTGYTYSNDLLQHVLLKLDSKGETLFLKTLPGSIYGAELTATSDGCFIMANTYNTINTSISGHKWLPAQIIKINAEGTELWRKNYSITYQHKLTSVKQATDGGFILAGLQENGHGFIIKTDDSGNELWRTSYENFTITEINPTENNGFVICGQRKTNSQLLEGYLMVTNETGSVIWSKVLTSDNLPVQTDNGIEYINYGGSIAYCVTELPNGIIAVGGESYFNQRTGFLRLFTPYDGIEIWNLNTNIHNTTGEYLGNIPQNILPTHDGQLMFTDSRGYMRKVSLTGTENWNRKVIPSTDKVVSFSRTSDNGYVMVGGSSYAMFIKTDLNGN